MKIETYFDDRSTNWTTSEYNRLFLRSQQNWANDMLASRGHLFVNEIHDMLGLPRISAGQTAGWIHSPAKKNDHQQISFGCWTHDGKLREQVREGAIRLEFEVEESIVHVLA